MGEHIDLGAELENFDGHRETKPASLNYDERFDAWADKRGYGSPTVDDKPENTFGTLADLKTQPWNQPPAWMRDRQRINDALFKNIDQDAILKAVTTWPNPFLPTIPPGGLGIIQSYAHDDDIGPRGLFQQSYFATGAYHVADPFAKWKPDLFPSTLDRMSDIRKTSVNDVVKDLLKDADLTITYRHDLTPPNLPAIPDDLPPWMRHNREECDE